MGEPEMPKIVDSLNCVPVGARCMPDNWGSKQVDPEDAEVWKLRNLALKQLSLQCVWQHCIYAVYAYKI